MDPINQLADRLRPASAARVVVGIVESVVDGTHVRVDLGDLMVSASWPASLGTPVAGVTCTLLVGDGVARVVSSDQPSPTSSVALTYTAGWATASGAATVCRDAGWAWMEGTIVRSSGSATSPFTIPAGYRPTRQIQFPVFTLNAGNADGPDMQLRVASTGVVRLASLV